MTAKCPNSIAPTVVSLKKNEDSEDVHPVKQTFTVLKSVKLNTGQNIKNSVNIAPTPKQISALTQRQIKPAPRKVTPNLALLLWWGKDVLLSATYKVAELKHYGILALKSASLMKSGKRNICLMRS